MRGRRAVADAFVRRPLAHSPCRFIIGRGCDEGDDVTTRMRMGNGFFTTVGRSSLLAVPSTALCCLILASCGGQDQTWATELPGGEVEQEDPQTPPEPPPEKVEPEPDAPDPDDTGVTPVDEE